MTNCITYFKRHWVAFCPVLLLMLIAFNQIYKKNTHYLSPWKGGGFGMFSDISVRYMHIHLINRRTFYCAKKPNDYKRILYKMKHYPSDSLLKTMGKKLTRHTWAFNPNNDIQMIGKKMTLSQTMRLVNFDAIQLQFFDVKFNKSSGIVTPKLLRKITINK